MVGMSVGGGGAGNYDPDAQSYITVLTAINDGQTLSQGSQHTEEKRERANPDSAGSSMSRRRLNTIISSRCNTHNEPRNISRVT